MNLMPELDFNELAVRFQQDKSEQNFAVLYSRTRPILSRFVANYIKNQEVANDVITDSYMYIHDKIHLYNPKWKFMTWAYVLARNCCLWELRRQKNFVTIDSDEDDDRTRGTQTEFNNKNSTNPDYEFYEFEPSREELFNRVLDVMDEMPEHFRDVVLDREFSGMSMKDLAKKHNLCENTVKTKLRNGRIWVRNRYFSKHGKSDIKHFIEKKNEYAEENLQGCC